MQIIAGRHKGALLEAPAGLNTRPTLQRIKENVFNLLTHGDYLPQNSWQGLKVLDVFAGSGQLGLEALSRGASKVCFIEHDASVRAVLRRNIEKLHAQGSTRVFSRPAQHADAMPPSAGGCFEVVFCDPPYAQNLILPTLNALHDGGWLSPNAIIYAESAANDPLLSDPAWQVRDSRSYGSVRCDFIAHH